MNLRRVHKLRLPQGLRLVGFREYGGTRALNAQGAEHRHRVVRSSRVIIIDESLDSFRGHLPSATYDHSFCVRE